MRQARAHARVDSNCNALLLPPPAGLKAGGNNRAPLVGVERALIYQTHSKLYCLCCVLTVVHIAHTMHAPCSTVALLLPNNETTYPGQ